VFISEKWIFIKKRHYFKMDIETGTNYRDFSKGRGRKNGNLGNLLVDIFQTVSMIDALRIY
jgi:hypothetical protein